MAADTLQDEIIRYLTDLHSTEEHGVTQLRSGVGMVQDEQLAQVLREHLGETEEHERLIQARLEALDASPSKLKDMAQTGAASVAAQRAGDRETAAMAELILQQEQAAAQKLDALLEQAALVGAPQIAA